MPTIKSIVFELLILFTIISGLFIFLIAKLSFDHLNGEFIHIINEQLLICNKKKFIKNSFLFNLGGIAIILLIITIILYIKYKGKQDVKMIRDRENKKIGTPKYSRTKVR